MPLPTQSPVYDKYYVMHVPSLAVASSPAVPIAGRGRVTDIRYVPITAPATAICTVTPKVNATQMQLNGAGVIGTIAVAAPVNVVTGVINPNGANLVDVGDAVVLTLSGGTTAGAGHFIVTVRETSQ